MQTFDPFGFISKLPKQYQESQTLVQQMQMLKQKQNIELEQLKRDKDLNAIYSQAVNNNLSLEDLSKSLAGAGFGKESQAMQLAAQKARQEKEQQSKMFFDQMLTLGVQQGDEDFVNKTVNAGKALFRGSDVEKVLSQIGKIQLKNGKALLSGVKTLNEGNEFGLPAGNYMVTQETDSSLSQKKLKSISPINERGEEVDFTPSNITSIFRSQMELGMTAQKAIESTLGVVSSFKPNTSWGKEDITSLVKKSKVKEYSTVEDIINDIKEQTLKAGDTVLVKGQEKQITEKMVKDILKKATSKTKSEPLPQPKKRGTEDIRKEWKSISKDLQF